MERRNDGWGAALLLLLALASCSPERPRQAAGGGGGPEGAALPVANPASHGTLSAMPAAYVTAYSRAPWLQANVATGDYALALDDLQTVRLQLESIEADRRHEVPAQVRARIRPLAARARDLEVSVQRHQPTALTGATQLASAFATTTRDLAALGWLSREGGGGAPAVQATAVPVPVDPIP